MDLSSIGLKSKAAAFKEVKAIATLHLGSKVVRADQCVLQGMFSYTVEVTMKDGSSYVVQLRAESVHEENSQQAHEILGDLVPVPTPVIRDGSPIPFAYIMPRVPGLTYYTATNRTAWPPEKHVRFAGQIGDMIGRCCSSRNVTECDIIDKFIVPRLQLYLGMDEPAIDPHKSLIRDLLQRVDELRVLPMCWSHWDINSINIMVDDDGNVTGVLDWEEAYWMPFGMNTCRLPDLAAWNRQGVLTKKPYSDEMDFAFWNSLFQAAPKAVRSYLREIQLAMDIGHVITTFFDGSEPPHPSHTGVLKDSMMWYKVPTDLSYLVFPPRIITLIILQKLDDEQFAARPCDVRG